MIQVDNLSKSYGKKMALDHITASIHDEHIFGLLGTNGAGKSTFLKILSGILKPDSGTVIIDDHPVFENELTKADICFLSDNPYFFPNATPHTMAHYYSLAYSQFDTIRFEELARQFHIDIQEKISDFSKGMKKQVSILLGICANTKYLFCDETFDGLDPVVRQSVKGIFAAELLNRNFTPVISSHNLRELEDICDHIGLLHKGGILLSQDLEDLKFHVHPLQCVIEDPVAEEELLRQLEILHREKRGSLTTIVARGTREEILERVNTKSPLFAEVLPLSLEEIFISETEAAGYDIKNFMY